MPYRSSEDARRALAGAGLSDVRHHIPVGATYTGFDDLWAPLTWAWARRARTSRSYLVGAARARARVSSSRGSGEPSGPFTLSATACAVRGLA